MGTTKTSTLVRNPNGLYPLRITNESRNIEVEVNDIPFDDAICLIESYMTDGEEAIFDELP